MDIYLHVDLWGRDVEDLFAEPVIRDAGCYCYPTIRILFLVLFRKKDVFVVYTARTFICIIKSRISFFVTCLLISS
jgi:hypothetical protein